MISKRVISGCGSSNLDRRFEYIFVTVHNMKMMKDDVHMK